MTSPGADPAGTQDASYARAVGERLRLVRRRRHLSLQAVELLSTQEFKASVLGAYERGERAISVPRLQRLAVLYDVAVDALLPGPAVGGSSPEAAGNGTNPGELDERLAAVAQRDPEILDRYLRMIRARRRSPQGATIAIREADVLAMELLVTTSTPTGTG